MDTFVVLGSAQGEIVEKKSRFIGTIREVHTESEATAFIEEMRRKYWDARHNCFAYVIGQNRELSRFSDDKEPQGTAGKPILEVLSGRCITNACIVVTRYFGGILLGTGGLVRAYTAGAEAAIGSLNGQDTAGVLLQLREGTDISFECEYKDAGKFESLIAAAEGYTVDKQYLEKAVYDVIIEDSRVPGFLKDAAEITRGQFSPLRTGQVTFAGDGARAILYKF